MRVQASNNFTSFGNQVIIKYSELKGLGQEAIKAAEAAKPILESRSDDMKYIITRAYTVDSNGNARKSGLDHVIPTANILVVAKRIKAGFEFKNPFKVSLSETGSASIFTEAEVIKAADIAEKSERNPQSINIFKLLFGNLPDSTGPR